MSGCASTRIGLHTATRAPRADRVRASLFAVLSLVVLRGLFAAAASPISPIAIVGSSDGATLYVAAATDNSLLVLEPTGALRQRVPLRGSPSGLALSPDGALLAITCAGPTSTIHFWDTRRAVIVGEVPVGHTALAPVFSRDGAMLFVAHRFQNEVGFVDVHKRQLVGRVPVEREPTALALSADGRRLWVANHLHATAADAQQVAAGVTIISVEARRVEKTIRLPNGSGLLLGLAVSPGGEYAAVTHNISHFQLPTTQVERGWMNAAALTLFDAQRLEIINTVLLDSAERGAANPWAVAWTADGSRLLVSHAGTHELSVIDFPALLAKLRALPVSLAAGQPPDFTRAANVCSEVVTDLAFLVEVRRRVSLHGNGPRSLAIVGSRAWVPGYFSDSIEVIDLAAKGEGSQPIALGAGPMSSIRRGEMLFNDARLCFQQWQSCASCHSYDARVDALNWDLLNDGIGSPKNVKSLLLAHRTPPAMSLGVRRNAEAAVRAGIRHILFATTAPEVPDAIDDYLSSLSPIPSPYLDKGKLSREAERGRRIFEDRKVGCASCHPRGLFTDLKSYDVGTSGPLDRADTAFDTPTLVEVWRTAPYLHDGSALTLRAVLVEHNQADRHGKTSHLKSQQIDELVAYVLSL